MPIYEYTCKSCNKPFEHLARTMNATGTVKCPHCGSPKTDRALSVFAVSSETKSSSSPSAPPGCGRCGGPGPCPSGF